MKHFHELEWNDDYREIYNTLTKYWMSLPSIVDDGVSKLPSVFDKIEEAYENPYRPGKYAYHFQQVLWFDRITNPTPECQRLLSLLDKYNIRHSVNYFHMATANFVDENMSMITNEFLPHRHIPGGVVRGTDDNRQGAVEKVAASTGPGEKETIIETTFVQFTFPFVNSNLGETQWSHIYDLPFKERRRFLEEEVTGRYRLNTKPVLFDVMTWHQGKNEVNDEDRLLIGLPTDFPSVEEAVVKLGEIQ